MTADIADYSVVARSVHRLMRDLIERGGVPRRLKVDRAVADVLVGHFMTRYGTDLTPVSFLGLEIDVVDAPEWLEVLS